MMIFLGLVMGRWPKTALVVAAIGWPALLFAEGVLPGPSDVAGTILGASLLAVANAGVGVLVHQAVWWLLRLVWLVGRRLAVRPGPDIT